MIVFGVGAALAGLAGVIAGPALVTQPAMASLLGPILFVVIIVGGLGSLTGRLRRLAADRHHPDFRGGDELSPSLRLFGPNAPPFLGDLWQVTIAQLAPIIPYLLLVLDADLPSDRPDGNARIMRASARFLLPWLLTALAFAVAPKIFSSGLVAHDDEPDGRDDHLRAVLQYAARTDRPAVVRPRRLFRPRRLCRHPCDERRHPRQARPARARSFRSSAGSPGSASASCSASSRQKGRASSFR